MNIFRFAVKNLAHRKVRTGLTILSIGIAIAVLFTVTSFNRGYEISLNDHIQKMGIHLMVVPIGCPYEAASLILKGGQILNYLPDSAVAEVNKVEGIDIAAPILMQGIVKPDEGRTDIFLGIDEATLRLRNWWKLKGRFFEKENEMVLGSDAALIELSGVGDQIYIPEFDMTFDVVGVLDATGTEDDGFFYIPLTAAQKMFKKEGKITGINIRLKDPGRASVIARRLEEIPQAEVITMAELLGTMLALVGSVRTLILSIVLIIIVISTFSVLNTILMSVFERVKEFGIMTASGAGRFHVFGLVWLESIVLSLCGGMLGLLMAIFAARGSEALIRKFLPIATSENIVSLQPGIFLYCLLFIIIIGIIAGFYPAYFAARQRPSEALRNI